ncbi:MAG: SIS domain-containing protein [Coriobacteriia bacterium]|nr:SIS domain-containing protein [Coriobacteriia bacterium]
MTGRIRSEIAEHLSAAGKLEAIAPAIAAAADALVASAANGGTLLVCGNGGSAADAQHIAAEYTGRYLLDRDPLPAIALHTNTSALTAVGNDYGFDAVFERQVRAFGKPGDAFLGLSTSGGSANVVAAARVARELGIATVALVGEAGGPLADICDVAICAPSGSTPRIQELHIVIAHILCGIVEERVCAKP